MLLPPNRPDDTGDQYAKAVYDLRARNYHLEHDHRLDTMASLRRSVR